MIVRIDHNPQHLDPENRGRVRSVFGKALAQGMGSLSFRVRRQQRTIHIPSEAQTEQQQWESLAEVARDIYTVLNDDGTPDTGIEDLLCGLDGARVVWALARHGEVKKENITT